MACPHGCETVCPYCDPRGFLVAYAKTRNVIERLGRSDAEIEEAVDAVMALEGNRG